MILSNTEILNKIDWHQFCLLINQFFITFFCQFIFINVKMSKDSSFNYYQDNKERQQKKACERYQSLSKEDKEKKWQYGKF